MCVRKYTRMGMTEVLNDKRMYCMCGRVIVKVCSICCWFELLQECICDSFGQTRTVLLTKNEIK